MAKAKDLTGQKFGRLVVIQRAGRHKTHATWLCECECGRTTEVVSWRLRRGTTKSCGCLPTGPKRSQKYFVGTKVGRVTITAREWDKKVRGPKFSYRCDCGNEGVTYGSYINRIQSCGCHVLEKRRTGFEGISGTYWGAVKKRAEAARIPFRLSIKTAWKLFQDQGECCAMTGVPLDLYSSRKTGKTQTASLDRKDSTKGYTARNVQWVHKTVNRMKGPLSDEEFVRWCRLVIERR